MIKGGELATAAPATLRAAGVDHDGDVDVRVEPAQRCRGRPSG